MAYLYFIRATIGISAETYTVGLRFSTPQGIGPLLLGGKVIEQWTSGVAFYNLHMLVTEA